MASFQVCTQCPWITEAVSPLPRERAPDYSSSISLPIKLMEKQKGRTQCTFWRCPWFRKSRWRNGAGIFTTESFCLQRTRLGTQREEDKHNTWTETRIDFPPSHLIVMPDSKEILPFVFSWVWVEFVFILAHHFFDHMLLMPGVAVFFLLWLGCGERKNMIPFHCSVKKRSHSQWKPSYF